MHYVIGDVHGCYDDMKRLIDKIEKRDAEAQFTFLGDFIDRGPKVYETLCWAMEHISADGKYQSVRGNHEQLALEYINNHNRWYIDVVEGGMKEYAEPTSYYDIWKVLSASVKGTGAGNHIQPEDYEKYYHFFNSLPYNKLLDVETVWGKKVKFRIVHGDCVYGESDADDQIYANIWKRNYIGHYDIDEICVHGHTPTLTRDYMMRGFGSCRPGIIDYRENSINIDGGCVFARDFYMYPAMLGAICLETLEEIYPYELEERFAQHIENFGLKFDAKGMADTYRERYLMKENEHRTNILKVMGCE